MLGEQSSRSVGSGSTEPLDEAKPPGVERQPALRRAELPRAFEGLHLLAGERTECSRSHYRCSGVGEKGYALLRAMPDEYLFRVVQRAPVVNDCNMPGDARN